MRARTICALLLGSVLLLGSCDNDATEREPSAPQVTDSADDPQLTRSLLSLSDLEALEDAPSALAEQPVQDSSLFENPDPRGPCGAKVTQPPISDAAIASFVTTQPPQVSVFHAVWELSTSEATELLGSFRADTYPGCSPFTSRTPFGKQRVQFLKEIKLPYRSNEVVAGTSQVTIPNAPTLYAGLVLYREGARVSLINAFSEDPLPERFIRAAAIEAAAKL